MSLPVIILGGGGHAKVLIEALRRSGIPIRGITDADPETRGTTIMGIPVLGDDAELDRYQPAAVQLVNAVGSVAQPAKRQAVYEAFIARGYTFASVVHPSAVVASDVHIGEGVQIMAGAVIQPGCSIGMNSIINTHAAVDHDCRIDAHVHLAPGTVLSGGVSVGEGTHIGTGATVIQRIRIGKGVLIGAGSLVTKDVPAGVRAYGAPAKVERE